MICASGEEYSIYLINSNGDILSKHLKTNNRPVLGRSVAFFALGNENILYQQDVSNDFLSYNTDTRVFDELSLLCDEDNALSIKTVDKQKKGEPAFNSFDHVDRNPNVKIIHGVSSYTDYLFFAFGNQNSGFSCFLMNTSNNTIDYLLTENTVDDISFTNTFSLLGLCSLSDSEDCFITYIYPYQIIDGLNKNIELSNHPNYQRFHSIFKDIQNIENENPVLIELRK